MLKDGVSFMMIMLIVNPLMIHFLLFRLNQLHLSVSPQQGGSPVNVSSASSVSQLESLGLDVLKEELMSRGLKCGGTLTERAARLFSVRGLNSDQIDPALLAKPGKTKRK